MSPESTKTVVLPPKASRDEQPLLVLWGTFSGSRDNLAGAVYLELSPADAEIRKLALSLFDSEASLSDFNPTQKPLAFRQQVQDKSGINGDVTRSDRKLVEDAFKGFIVNEDRLSEFESILHEESESDFGGAMERLVSRIIRKGSKNYNFSGQALPADELTRDTTGEPEEKDTATPDKGKDTKEEKDVNYHRISIVTIPLKGIEPVDLVPGEEIYVRAIGELAGKFPDELQADRDEQMTEPIEAAVEAVDLEPNLPANFDGQPEDYVGVKVDIPGQFHGEGFVYEKETVKPVGSLEKESESLDPVMVSSVFFGVGLLFVTLAGVAYYLFG